MRDTIKTLLCAVLLLPSPLVASSGGTQNQEETAAYDYRQLRGRDEREREPGHGGAAGGIGATARVESFLLALVFDKKLPSYVGPNQVQAITANSIGNGMSNVVLEHANTARPITAELTGIVVGTRDPRSVYISLGVTTGPVSGVSETLGAFVINGFVDPENFSQQNVGILGCGCPEGQSTATFQNKVENLMYIDVLLFPVI